MSENRHYVPEVDAGGGRVAAIYTLVQTKLNGVTPEAQLKVILTKIAEGYPISRIKELLPWPIIPPTAASPS